LLPFLEDDKLSESEDYKMKILLATLLTALAFTCFACATRSVDDSGITARVKSNLAADSETSAMRISVETNGGVVTLSGAVPTAAEKSKAEQLAKNTEGVTRVVNNIAVDASAGTTNMGDRAGDAMSDATILAKIKSQFLAEGIVGTNVDVTNGEVVIKGEVENAQEKTTAENIARKTEGVKNVKSELTIKR
jgi:osmotically-inducible protein OsmY